MKFKFKVGDKVVSVHDGKEYTIKETFVGFLGTLLYKIDESPSIYDENELDFVKPSISLKLEGIDEGEKFNIITKNGNVHFNSPHYVKGNYVYNCFGRNQKGTLHDILDGNLSIEKINPKQLEIDRIKNEMRELADKQNKLADELEELEHETR